MIKVSKIVFSSSEQMKRKIENGHQNDDSYWENEGYAVIHRCPGY